MVISAVFIVFPLLIFQQIVGPDVVISSRDPLIIYKTGSNDSVGKTWIADLDTSKCVNPQMNTERIGDSASFTFTGTAIRVTGSKGKLRGVAKIELDGVLVVPRMDRTNVDAIECDSLWYNTTGLPKQPHTIVLTLIEHQRNIVNSTGPLGILSIQNFIYSPDDAANNISHTGADSPKPAPLSRVAVVGAISASLVLLGIVVGLIIWKQKRKRHRAHVQHLDLAPSVNNHNIHPDYYHYSTGNTLPYPLMGSLGDVTIEPFVWGPSTSPNHRRLPSETEVPLLARTYNAVNALPYESTASLKSSRQPLSDTSITNSDGTMADTSRSMMVPNARFWRVVDYMQGQGAGVPYVDAPPTYQTNHAEIPRPINSGKEAFGLSHSRFIVN